MGNPDKPPRVSVLVKALVLFHVFMVVSWSFPRPADAIMNGVASPQGEEWLLYLNQRYVKDQPALNWYLLSTGLWQGWDMFAPNPSSTDLWFDADVTYKDGTVKHFAYPRMKALPIPVKLVKERFRKFYERVNQDQYNYIWPVVGQRIALESYKDPANPPARVTMVRHWKSIPPLGTPPPEDYQSYVFFVHVVDQQKLKQDAGF